MMKYRQSLMVDYAHRLFQTSNQDYPRSWIIIYKDIVLTQQENKICDQQIENFIQDNHLTLVRKDSLYYFGKRDWRVRIENKLGYDAFYIARSFFELGLGYAEPEIGGYAPWP